MFKYKKRIKLIFHESIHEELWHQTLKGSLGKIGEGETQLEDFFDVEILTQNQFHIFGNDYQIFNVRHTENKATFGVNINKEIFYSSDTTAIPDIIAAQTFHTGFHDVTLTDSNPVHAPLSNLIEQYPETIRQTLYLMSYEDNWRDFQSTVEREFKGFATQGMKIHF